jgi:hypothetical protein
VKKNFSFISHRKFDEHIFGALPKGQRQAVNNDKENKEFQKSGSHFGKLETLHYQRHS